MKNKLYLLFILLAVVDSFSAHEANAQKESAKTTKDSLFYVPKTVSPAWQRALANYPDPGLSPRLPEPGDLTAWKALQQAGELEMAAEISALVEHYQADVSAKRYNGVPVLDIKPENWRDNGKLIVYTHGGSYTYYSARTSLPSSLLMAQSTGLRVISVDYTLAPHAQWKEVISQVLAVFDYLRHEGYAWKDMAIYGDSAGGGLAAGSVLMLRDKGLGMPGAVVLWSPWSDITETGDTYFTLKDAEPSYRYDMHLKPSADAYAPPSEQKNPYVSPVYGDYSRGFPPTLIQGGTKEIFLSNFVRLYQALDSAGQTVKLDLYEGMPHVFQIYFPKTPETVTALKKVDAFLRLHLDF